MVEVYASKQTEKIEVPVQLDINILKKRSSAKTYKGWMIKTIKELHAKSKNSVTLAETNYYRELAFLAEAFYKKYMELEFNGMARVNLEGWKGKSSLKIIKHPELFQMISYKKKDQDHEAKETVREIPKEEVNFAIQTINSLSYMKKIPTENIAEGFCKLYGLEKNDSDLPFFTDGKFIFDHFFSDRYWHTQMNLILRLLDYYKVIKYRAGYTEVIGEKIEAQTIL